MLSHANTFHFRKQNLPPPRSFYESVFGNLGRERRGWAQIKCPFHAGQSKTSLALNLVTGGFYCFSCGTSGGDIIDFFRIRNHVHFITAAKRLGAWGDDGRGPTRAQLRELQRQRERRRFEEEQRRDEDRRKRVAARDWLLLLKRIHGRIGERLTALQRGATESFPGEIENCWSILSDSLPLIRTADWEYLRIAGLR